MEFVDGMALVEYAINQEADDKIFQRWIQFAQTEMSFEEFKRALSPVPDRDEKEVIKDVANILNSFEMR